MEIKKAEKRKSDDEKKNMNAKLYILLSIFKKHQRHFEELVSIYMQEIYIISLRFLVLAAFIRCKCGNGINNILKIIAYPESLLEYSIFHSRTSRFWKI